MSFIKKESERKRKFHFNDKEEKNEIFPPSPHSFTTTQHKESKRTKVRKKPTCRNLIKTPVMEFSLRQRNPLFGIVNIALV